MNDLAIIIAASIQAPTESQGHVTEAIYQFTSLLLKNNISTML